MSGRKDVEAIDDLVAEQEAFLQEIEVSIAEKKVEENANKASFEQMFSKDAKRLYRDTENGRECYVIKKPTLGQQLAEARILDNMLARGQTMESMFLYNVDKVQLILEIEDSEGKRTPITAAQIYERFLAEDLSEIIEANSAKVTEGEEGANPPTP